MEAKKVVSLGFEQSRLADARLGRRLVSVGKRLWQRPHCSNPEALGSTAEREGFYRLLSNERVDVAKILSGPFKQTLERAARLPEAEVLAIHDTSTLCFSSKREGLGRVTGEKSPYGMFAHVGLCVAFGGEADSEVLGLCALQTWTRAQGEAPVKAEGSRWLGGAEQSKQLFGRRRLTHVMDREADSYTLYRDVMRQGDDFVVRVYLDRETEQGKLMSVGQGAEVRAKRQVRLSARRRHSSPAKRRLHPARSKRMAKLVIRACAVDVWAPKSLRQAAKVAHLDKQPLRQAAKVAHLDKQPLRLNLLDLQEVEPPAGEPAVCWRLLTNKAINTEAQVMAVVDIYRKRWLIEELFKALKSGCQFERQQLESYKTLLAALGCYLPVAAELLRLRAMRSEKSMPATKLLSPLQIKALRVLAPCLEDKPTAQSAVYAIAAIGGHFKSNGPPGWQTIARGYAQLSLLAQGIQIGQRCDQS